MRLSKLFMPTLKEVPKEATVESHKLMLRAGLIRKISAGLYSFLPLGLKVLNKIMDIVRGEMDKTGAQEFLQPILIPKELWEESGRYEAMGDLMMKLNDRGNRGLILGPTHEEVFTHIVLNELRSYKDLPFNLYQIGTKFRDEIRPRFGVMRAREFIMKDAYSFHENDQSLDETYKDMSGAYTKIFKRCGLETVRVAADSGAMGGAGSEEFMVPAEIGEETIVLCKACAYVANVEKATTTEKTHKKQEKINETEKVSTPGVKTIEQLEGFFKTEAKNFIKTLIYVDDKKTPYMVLIRGDLDVNEVKLVNALGVNEIEIADNKTVFDVTGAPTGFAGPLNIDNVEIIADNSVKSVVNGITGANEKDYHVININPERDFKISEYTDLRLVKAGDSCPVCGLALESFKGIEVGHIFKLGDKYTKAFNVTYLDENQKERVPIMGCYGIGIGRTMACVIEQMHDENGIIWPMSIAPYHVIIIPMGKPGQETFKTAEKIYNDLIGYCAPPFVVDVLIDDRDERAGVKFKDADLIGVPIRITVGKKSLEHGCVEFKLRHEKENSLVKFEDINSRVLNAYFEGFNELTL